MELGELITKYRKQSGMTIEELSEKSGVAKGTLNKIIGGVTKAPTLDNMKAIAYALGKKLADFDDDISVPNIISDSEQCLVKKYRTLDEYGKAAVDSILNIEHKRCAEQVDSPRPMVMAAARSGAVSQIEEIHLDELPDNTPLP